VEQHGAPLAAFVDGLLNARGVELLLVGGSERMAIRRKLRVHRGAKLRE
jgi:hypothetical protein